MISVEATRLTAIIGPPASGKTWALFHAAKLASRAPLVMWSSTHRVPSLTRTAGLFGIREGARLLGGSVGIDRALRVGASNYFLDDVAAFSWQDLKSLGEFARTHRAGVAVTLTSQRTEDGGTTTRKLFESIEPACAMVWAFHKTVPWRLVCLKGESVGGSVSMREPPDTSAMHWVDQPNNRRGADVWSLLRKDPFAP